MFGIGERNIPQTATQTQTSTIDEGMRGFRDGLFDYANQNILDRGFQGYGGDRFSGFNQDQMDAFQAVRDQQGMGSGSYQGAIDASQRVANMGSPQLQYQSFLNMGDPSAYMNPYTQNVINPAVQRAQDELTRNLSQITANATKLSPAGRNEGEFLERGVARAEGIKNIGELQANLLNQGYNQAQAMMERDIARGDQYGFKQAGLDLSTTDRNLAGAGNVANIMDRYRNARRGDTRDLMGIGDQQQAQNQRDLDFAYQEFMREQGDPMMRLGAVQGLLSGPYGKTTTGTTESSLFKDDLADALGLVAGTAGAIGSTETGAKFLFG